MHHSTHKYALSYMAEHNEHFIGLRARTGIIYPNGIHRSSDVSSAITERLRDYFDIKKILKELSHLLSNRFSVCFEIF